MDEAAAAAALLGQTVFAARPGVHAVHIAAEMVPLAKVRWLGRGVRVEDGQTDRQPVCMDVTPHSLQLHSSLAPSPLHGSQLPYHTYWIYT